MDAGIFDKKNSTTDLIYHYTSKVVALEKILYRRELRFSPLQYTNDPKEYKKLSFVTRGTAVNGKIPDDKMRIETQKVDQEINRIVKYNYKIACFCLDTWLVYQKKDYDCIERGFARSRMWSQYTDNHEGICLAFSKAKLIEALKNQKESKIQYLEGEMDYVKHPNISGINTSSLNGNKIQELGTSKYIKKHISTQETNK